MTTVAFRFYGPLNDFLPRLQRQATLVCAYQGRMNVKDAIESLGVPHPEVDLIVVNGMPVPFDYAVQPRDRVAVYPAFTHIGLPRELRLIPPLVEPRFVADAHLGRLAAYLRLLGFDTAYRNDVADEDLAERSANEDRVLLTRDLGVLKRGIVRRGYFLRATNPARQLVEVVRRYDLAPQARPFSRCLPCNAPLAPAPKTHVAPFVPPRSRDHFEAFSRCPACGRVYWQGSHYARMRRLVEAALGGG
jgi:uncharacterized protein with PIN domain/sulfur carrier protein ThiS